MISCFFVLVFFLEVFCWINGVIGHSANNVPELSAANFNSTIDSDQHTLVMFYAPWCGHCQDAKPKFKAAFSTIINIDKTKMLALLNCDDNQNSALCSEMNIEGYPTLRLFHKGQLVQEFEEDITEERLVEYMKTPPKPGDVSARKSEDSDHREPEQPDTPMKNVVYLSSTNFTSFLGVQEHVLIFFYAPWCPHCQDAKPAFEKAASKSFETKQKNKVYAAINCDSPQTKVKCAEEKVEGYPTVRYYKKGEMYAEFEDEIKEDSILKFMDNPPNEKIPITPIEQNPNNKMVNLDKVEKDVNSGQEKPEERMSGVEYLDATTFKSFVSVQGRQIFVFFYAPWCPFCQKIKPLIQSAAGKIQSRSPNNLLVALNCDDKQNQKLCEEEKIEGFPTLIHYSNGAKVKEYSETPPTEKGLLDYMSSLSAGKDEL